MDDCALDEEEEFLLKKYVEDKGAIFLSTPFSRAAFHRLEKFNVQAFKIGSGECNNYPLLDLVARNGKPIILSTGMNSFDSIDKAVDIFKKNKIPYAAYSILQTCISPHNLVRLDSVTQLQERYKVPIGLSDHTIDNNACIGAVALGASILERHFTDSMLREGQTLFAQWILKRQKNSFKHQNCLSMQRRK